FSSLNPLDGSVSSGGSKSFGVSMLMVMLTRRINHDLINHPHYLLTIDAGWVGCPYSGLGGDGLSTLSDLEAGNLVRNSDFVVCI
ncbi:hypothetical protein Pfo_003261, partial [Paulownia fortunei]